MTNDKAGNLSFQYVETPIRYTNTHTLFVYL